MIDDYTVSHSDEYLTWDFKRLSELIFEDNESVTPFDEIDEVLEI